MLCWLHFVGLRRSWFSEAFFGSWVLSRELHFHPVLIQLPARVYVASVLQGEYIVQATGTVLVVLVPYNSTSTWQPQCHFLSWSWSLFDGSSCCTCTCTTWLVLTWTVSKCGALTLKRRPASPRYLFHSRLIGDTGEIHPTSTSTHLLVSGVRLRLRLRYLYLYKYCTYLCCSFLADLAPVAQVQVLATDSGLRVSEYAGGYLCKYCTRYKYLYYYWHCTCTTT